MISLFVPIFLWKLYICLLLYVFVLHTIYSLVVIHIGKRVMYIYWFIMPLLPSLLTCIHNSGLTPPWLNLPFICQMHLNTYIHSCFLFNSYISFSFKVFYCILLLGQMFTFYIQNSNTCNQHHIYTIFEQISNLSCSIFGHTCIQCMTLTTR